MKSVYALLRVSSISMKINFDLVKNCILPHKGITSERCKNKNDHIEIKITHTREIEGVFYIQYILHLLQWVIREVQKAEMSNFRFYRFLVKQGLIKYDLPQVVLFYAALILLVMNPLLWERFYPLSYLIIENHFFRMYILIFCNLAFHFELTLIHLFT